MVNQISEGKIKKQIAAVNPQLWLFTSLPPYTFCHRHFKAVELKC